MEVLAKIILWAHIIGGSLTLLAGPVAIFYNFKNKQKHRLAGKIFFYAMLVVVFSSWGGYLKKPDVVFYQFLLGVAMMVLANILRGVRAMQFMQGRARVGALDWAYTGLIGVFSLWMAGMSAYHFLHGTMIAFPILFAFFGIGSMFTTAENIRVFRNPLVVTGMQWYKMHVHTMIGAFIASTTAFTVNAAHFLPWYLQWFGPTLLLIPVQVYFGRKLKSMEQRKTAVPVSA